MKNILKISVVTVLLLASCEPIEPIEPVDPIDEPTSTEEKTVESIDEEVSQIEAQKDTYLMIEREPSLPSTEGGVSQFYYESTDLPVTEGSEVVLQELKKIETTLYGEMGKTVMHFYYQEEVLILVKEERTDYNVPFYHESFDQDLSTVTMQSFYFNGANMLAWVNPEGSLVSPEDAEFKMEEQEWLDINQTLLVL